MRRATSRICRSSHLAFDWPGEAVYRTRTTIRSTS